VRVPRDDGKGAFRDMQRGIGAVGDVEPKMGLAVVGVGAVAFETLIGKNGADVVVVADYVRNFFGIRAAVMAETGGGETDRAGNGDNDGKTSNSHTHLQSTEKSNRLVCNR